MRRERADWASFSSRWRFAPDPGPSTGGRSQVRRAHRPVTSSTRSNPQISNHRKRPEDYRPTPPKNCCNGWPRVASIGETPRKRKDQRMEAAPRGRFCPRSCTGMCRPRFKPPRQRLGDKGEVALDSLHAPHRSAGGSPQISSSESAGEPPAPVAPVHGPNVRHLSRFLRMSGNSTLSP